MISAAEIFFQPEVRHNEKIPAFHFLDLKSGKAGLSVAPGNRHDFREIAGDNGFNGSSTVRFEVAA